MPVLNQVPGGQIAPLLMVKQDMVLGIVAVHLYKRDTVLLQLPLAFQRVFLRSVVTHAIDNAFHAGICQGVNHVHIALVRVPRVAKHHIVASRLTCTVHSFCKNGKKHIADIANNKAYSVCTVCRQPHCQTVWRIIQFLCGLQNFLS